MPTSALRATIEAGARLLKQGPQVRQGLLVTHVESFDWDKKALGSTPDEISEKAQFTVRGVINRASVPITRALFEAWSTTFVVEYDPELVDKDQLWRWLNLAGRRVGVGDWRPEKSGHYGRFEVVSIEEIAA